MDAWGVKKWDRNNRDYIFVYMLKFERRSNFSMYTHLWIDINYNVNVSMNYLIK